MTDISWIDAVFVEVLEWGFDDNCRICSDPIEKADETPFKAGRDVTRCPRSLLRD